MILKNKEVQLNAAMEEAGMLGRISTPVQDS
jgi:hypothetical protein